MGTSRTRHGKDKRHNEGPYSERGAMLPRRWIDIGHKTRDVLCGRRPALEPRKLHEWDVTPKEAVAVQRALKKSQAD
jgi:hypothetical protein